MGTESFGVGNSFCFISMEMVGLSIHWKHYACSYSSSLSLSVYQNRFINTHGRLGQNIPCDLHNEYVNKLYKEIITNMGTKLTDESMQRAARAVTTLHQIRSNFDNESGVSVGTSAHITRPDDTDVLRVTSVVSGKVEPGHCHSIFRISANPLS